MFAVVAIFGVATDRVRAFELFPLSLPSFAVLGASDAVSVVIRVFTGADRDARRKARPGERDQLSVRRVIEYAWRIRIRLVAAWLGAVPSVIIGGIGSLVVAGDLDVNVS